MKRIAILGLAAFMVACNNSAPVATTNTNTNSGNTSRTEKMQSVASHTTENQLPPAANTSAPSASNTNSSAPKSKWTQSGNPIDTKEMDAKIAQAEKNFKAKPKDAAAKTAISGAYFDRGFALTEARQYASALGDFRKALKHDPSNAEAQKWIDQIISIYNSINKEFPKEGEEPPALPFTGEK